MFSGGRNSVRSGLRLLQRRVYRFVNCFGAAVGLESWALQGVERGRRGVVMHGVVGGSGVGTRVRRGKNGSRLSILWRTEARAHRRALDHLRSRPGISRWIHPRTARNHRRRIAAPVLMPPSSVEVGTVEYPEIRGQAPSIVERSKRSWGEEPRWRLNT